MKSAVQGVRYLDSAIGEAAFVEQFFRDKIEELYTEIQQLSRFAETEPRAAFAALTHGLRGKYTYLLRTLPASVNELQSMGDALVCQLLPALTGRSNFSAEELELLRLPARLGGMGISHSTSTAADELAASRAMAEGQVREILLQTMKQHESTESTELQSQLGIGPRQSGERETLSGRKA